MSNFSFEYFESDELPQLFVALKRTFDSVNVPFYLIGARARDVWFLPEKNIRITKDIDWIAASEEDAVFQEIKTKLIDLEGFKKTNNPYSLKSPNGMTVDLLPFVGSSGHSLDGLKEIFERGTEGVVFDRGETYQVATIPAIVLLKLIAWDDRPEYRLKDLEDIGLIFEYYFDQFSDDIYDNHNDLFDDRELEEIAAYVIGRKINFIVGHSFDLKKRIIHILIDKKEPITQRLAAKSSKTEQFVKLILKNLLDGILEER